MSTPYWLDRSPQQQKQTYDVVIIGGGISGLSTAYWLHQEDPNLRVALLEKNSLGSGATGRNAGFITCGSVEHFNRMVSKHGEQQALEIWRFAEENMNLLKNHIIEGDGSQVEFAQRGAYSLAAEETEFKELKQVSDIMKKHNIPVEVYGADEVLKNVGAMGFVGGIKYCRDGEVHPWKLAQWIAKKCHADCFEQTEAFQVLDNGDGTRVVKTSKGDFEAPLVVFCLNGYSNLMSDYFKDKIYPTRGQMLMMEPMEMFMDGPCYANFYLDYFRQMPTGELLIGGFRQLEKETEVGYSDHITDSIQEALHDLVRKHLPKLQDKKVTHRWAGIMGFSQDGEPLIGSLPNDSQTFFCGGYTGHGIGLAFHASQKLVDLIFGRSIPDWLSSRRF